MASLLVLHTTSPCLPAPTAANSMPSPIEHMPCVVEIVPGERVRFSLLPHRGWISRIPLPVKPAGKMPSSLFHIYTNGAVAIPKHQLRRAEQIFDCAASKYVKLHADKHEVAGAATPARQPSRKTAKATAPVPPPVAGAPKRTRSSLPVKTAVKAPTKPKVEAKAAVEAKPIVEAKPKPEPTPKVEVKPRSILKPTRIRDVECFIRHCTVAPPDERGCLLPASESIANSSVSRFRTSEWDIDSLPINMPDRFKVLSFGEQERKKTSVNFHEHLVSDSWTASGRAVIRNHAVVRYRLKSKA